MYQEVLTLYYFGGMEGKEIAKFLGISHDNVKQRWLFGLLRGNDSC
jgi:DNA-directed RNA polymerase specialized sigma24 family protein